MMDPVGVIALETLTLIAQVVEVCRCFYFSHIFLTANKKKSKRSGCLLQ